MEYFESKEIDLQLIKEWKTEVDNLSEYNIAFSRYAPLGSNYGSYTDNVTMSVFWVVSEYASSLKDKIWKCTLYRC